jgi:hypothetical protein
MHTPYRYIGQAFVIAMFFTLCYNLRNYCNFDGLAGLGIMSSMVLAATALSLTLRLWLLKRRISNARQLRY